MSISPAERGTQSTAGQYHRCSLVVYRRQRGSGRGVTTGAEEGPAAASATDVRDGRDVHGAAAAPPTLGIRNGGMRASKGGVRALLLMLGGPMRPCRCRGRRRPRHNSLRPPRLHPRGQRLWPSR